MDDSFEDDANAVIQRTYIINAYLALLYTHELKTRRLSLERMVITPELTLSLDSIDDTTNMGFGNQRVSYLATAKFPSSYQVGLPFGLDDRISMRGPAISHEAVDGAAENLSQVMIEHGAEGVLLLDLFLRGSKAYQDHNHNFSLINCWTITERLLNDLWTMMQENIKSTHGSTFIDHTRRKRLSDGRTFTASVIAEMLSFLGYISKDLYDDISSVRKLRNDWMHSLKPVSASSVDLAMSVCERLLKQSKNIEVIGARVRRLHG
ncbi:hypothetical protein IU469_32235 [Nocardia puris]|uniref:hypothetical protein n=1 Tax=Nocardia puris TaxID=208602 RepID=UPI0018962678|nr:hypothetical protein [Nocardia puris]MBF6216249.1 hypothetical protein [Nocardia puris]MBF6370339.1 hypothetical protein [Nocardia puris]